VYVGNARRATMDVGLSCCLSREAKSQRESTSVGVSTFLAILLTVATFSGKRVLVGKFGVDAAETRTSGRGEITRFVVSRKMVLC